MILYISGAMSGLPDYNRPAFHAAERELSAAGYRVYNPAHMPKGLTWEQYMQIDLYMLRLCDGLAMLPGWHQSKGASEEHYEATRLGLPRLSVSQWIERAEFVGLLNVNPITYDPLTGLERCSSKHPRWNALTCMRGKGHTGDHVNCELAWNSNGYYELEKQYHKHTKE